VVKFGPGNILWAKDRDLKRAFGDLKRRHIALALEAGLLTKTDRCQQRSEAYLDHLLTLRQMIEKIHRDGGDLRFIAMDEPFFYGHEYSGPTACHDSASAIAGQIGQNLYVIRIIFPKVIVGDIEPVGASRPWIGQLAHWVDAYRTTTGQKLAFLDTDVDWSYEAMRNVGPLAAELKRRNVPLGIIYNASKYAHSDLSWTRSAVRHFITIEDVLGIHPTAAIFQSWVPYPTHMLPEWQPGTLTNVAFQYLHPAPTLTLSRQGTTLAGHLTGSHGRPVARATVTLEAVDVAARMSPVPRRIARTVPAGAATAVIGIRANTEGSCVCAGPATVTLGMIHYRDPATGSVQSVPPGVATNSARPRSIWPAGSAWTPTSY